MRLHLKRNYLLSCLILSSFSLVNAQYLAFPDSGSVWKCDEFNSDVVWYCAGSETIIYGLHDTIQSGGQTYQKVHYLGSGVCQVTQGFQFTCGGFSYGWQGVRTDTSTGKVYGLDGGNAEIELFDYSLNPGDTMLSYRGRGWAWNVVVDSVDTVLIGGLQRRRLFLIPDIGMGRDEIIIEGIGPNYGLFAFPGMGINAESGTLVCYSENAVPVFTTPGACSAGYDCLTVNAEEAVSEAKLEAFPNPSTGLFRIVLPPAREGKLDLYDLSGRNHLELVLDYSSGEMNLDLTELPRGHYFLRFIDLEGEMESTRIWLQ